MLDTRRLRDHAREVVLRCAFCHDDGGRLRACERCATRLHRDCWAVSLRCPSLGCSGGPAAAGVRLLSEARDLARDLARTGLQVLGFLVVSSLGAAGLGTLAVAAMLLPMIGRGPRSTEEAPESPGRWSIHVRPDGR